MNKQKVSILYKIIIVLCVLIGVLLQCEIGTSSFSLSSFRMFTTLSNVLVGIFFIYDIYHSIKLINNEFDYKSKNYFRKYFKFMITMSIMLTGLVAHFMLQGMFDNMDQMIKIGLIFLHYIVPIMTVLDFFIFDIKGATTKLMPIVASIFPIIYVVFSMILAQFIIGKNKYPYPFLNIDILGIKAVIMNIIFLAIAFIVVGYLGVFIDKNISKNN